MEFIEDLAIVLRVIPYQERDKVITAITECHGKITVLAKNSTQSRRFGGSLDLFSASKWMVKVSHGSELGFLEKSEIKKTFENLKNQFEVLSTASILNEFLLKLSADAPGSQELFKLHSNALTLLDDLSREGTVEPKMIFAVLSAYSLKLLQWGGTQPLLQKCFLCEASLLKQSSGAQLKSLASKAGWACPNCSQGSQATSVTGDVFRLSPGELGYMIHLMTNPIRKIHSELYDMLNDDEIYQMFTFVLALLTYHLPGFDISEIKSLRFIDPKSSLLHQKDRLQ